MLEHAPLCLLSEQLRIPVVMQCGEHVILHQRKLISLLNQVLAVFALDLSTANSLRNNREFRG